MSRGVNKVILVGNLGQKPEIRYTATQTAVANLSIATTESWKNKETGEPDSKTEWHKVVFFGNLAEIAKQYLDKGSSVYVEGKIQTRKWKDQEGKDRWTTEILGNQLTMLGSRNSSDSSMQSNATSNATSDTPFPEDDSGPGLTDDDIPF
tara:strand:+ start:4276 stop:4725 length:450 start_codon:yes stop_codon:yes gene_type:complete